jgi:asparagine synthase (glutamine-hydrolysing)
VCGISGVAFTNQNHDPQSCVRSMTAALAHRGPDDESFLIDNARAPGVVLGMRRLSIIDLPGGHQPIWNETHDVAVIFNGELYNYRQLRESLLLCGHKFSTKSDTEVLVHAWEEWGEDCLSELRGMFAFALIDFRKRHASVPILLLARDPLGIKPLYYAQTPDGLAFASEVRALLAANITSKKISQDALTSYLLFGSLSEPVTLLDDIFSLPPGHRMMTYIPERRRVPRPRPWYDHAATPASKSPQHPKDFSSAARALRPLLQDAVESHLIADVPVGLFLSSGLDSSAIAMLAGRAHPGIRSFTLTFPGTPFDEAALARLVADRCRSQHTEVPLNDTAIFSRVDEALAALDQPTMDGMNTYFVSWAAREVGLKVALSGLGGDELFGGYSTFSDVPRLAKLARIAKLLPASLRYSLAPLMHSALTAAGSSDAARKATAAWSQPAILPHLYFFARALFPPGARLNSLMHPQFRPSSIGADGVTLDPTWLGWLQRAADEARDMSPLAAISWLEMRSYMASTLLRDTDAVSMARSLEVRVPFLDTPLVEFVIALPDAARRSGKAQKPLLVESMRDLLPPEILAQRKRTFTLPWEQWLRGPLRPRLEASFNSLAPALAPHLHTDGVRAVWNEFLAGKTSWSRPWSLFVLNDWCRRHLPA